MWGKPGRPVARKTFLGAPAHLLSTPPWKLWQQMKPRSDSHFVKQTQPLLVWWEHFPLYTLNSVSWNPGLCPSFYHPFLSHTSHIHPCLANTSLANSNGFRRLVALTWCICVLLGVTTVWRLVWMWAAPSPRLGLDGINREWGKDSLAQVCANSYFLAIKT